MGSGDLGGQMQADGIVLFGIVVLPVFVGLIEGVVSRRGPFGIAISIALAVAGGVIVTAVVAAMQNVPLTVAGLAIKSSAVTTLLGAILGGALVPLGLVRSMRGAKRK